MATHFIAASAAARVPLLACPAVPSGATAGLSSSALFISTNFINAAAAARLRHGLSVVEIFVALSLLGTGLSLSASLVVRQGRLVAEQRQYRLALDELSNQLELLIGALPADPEQALERLAVSEFAAAHLPAAKLAGTVKPSELGRQVTLFITWDGRATNAAPLALSAWVVESDRSARPVSPERSQP